MPPSSTSGTHKKPAISQDRSTLKIFTLERYQAQPECSAFGDLTLTEQSEGKTVPVLHSRVKELI